MTISLQLVIFSLFFCIFGVNYFYLFIAGLSFFYLIKKFDKNTSFYMHHSHLNKVCYTELISLSLLIFPFVTLFVQHFCVFFIPVKFENVNIMNVIHKKTTLLNGDITYKVNNKYHREDLKPARYENHKYKAQYWWKGNLIPIEKNFHETKWVDHKVLKELIKPLITKEKLKDF
jgi:hypothetical protein